MLTEPPPMTNAQRQRRFQERNPGYDRRRKAKRRAAQQVELQRYILAMQAAAAVEVRESLMLPAPVEPVVFPWTVEEVRQRAAAEQREAVRVER